MTKLAQITLLVFAVLCLHATAAYGQQIATIAQLREQIKEFEVVAREANTQGPVKIINGSFLMERRAQLRTLLQYQVVSLRKYQTDYQSHFSAKEKQVVAESIRTLQIEIASLGESSPAPSIAERFNARVSEAKAAGAPTAKTAAMPAAALPQTKRDKIWSEPQEISNAPNTYMVLDQQNAQIIKSEGAARIINEAITNQMFRDELGNVVAPDQPAAPEFLNDFYCVIHVVRWADPSETTDTATGTKTRTQVVAAQNWYVFNNGKGKGFGSRHIWSDEDFTKLNRLFGVKKVWLLYLHLNRRCDIPYDQARYDFTIEKKAPANVSNVFALAQLFITFPSAAVAAAGCDPREQKNFWGGGAVDVPYVPSDITITASVVKNPAAANEPVVSVDKPKKFDNEGRYWWDVSVAVPVRHISQTQFDTSANTVTAKEVDQQNAFALLNLYPVPVDIKGSNFTWIPHFIGGVAIAKQPLKKFLLGAGFGPSFANFYVGAVFTEEKKPATLKAGDTATPDQLNADLRKSFKPKFSFGFNLPVRGVIEALKKQSK